MHFIEDLTNMVYKRFILNIIFRIILLFTSLLVLAFIISLNERLFSIIVFVAISILQLISLLFYISKTNRELTRFLLSIKYEDMTLTFPDYKLGNKFDDLFDAFSIIIKTIKDSKIEKEAQFYYLKKLIENTIVGIIALDRDNNIDLINDAAGRILGIKRIDSWKTLQTNVPEFTNEADKLKTSGKRLVRIVIDENVKELSLQVNSYKILDKYIRLLTFQNIGTEIEQKEVEAWQKLIRTIAHEIMNSVTPISSLTETGISLLEDDSGNQKQLSEIKNKDITSVRTALKTIGKRSDGLYNFVDDYRKLAKISQVLKTDFRIVELLNSIKNLMESDFKKKNIKFSFTVKPAYLILSADRNQIEQLLLNLINNSISAMDKKELPEINIKSYQEAENIIITVSDNGDGVPKEKIDKIFVPFYTTKEEGSGIGLSLSRQIMQLHGGSIGVVSKPGIKTTFSLKF